eukprot:1934145-Amphidinium_carterae.1
MPGRDQALAAWPRNVGKRGEGQASAGYVAARAGKRLMSDCYSRGVVRGAVETANLILHNNARNAEDAESIKTAPVVEIAMNYGLRLMEAARQQEDLPQERASKQPSARPRVLGGQCMDIAARTR